MIKGFWGNYSLETSLTYTLHCKIISKQHHIAVMRDQITLLWPSLILTQSLHPHRSGNQNTLRLQKQLKADRLHRGHLRHPNSWLLRMGICCRNTSALSILWCLGLLLRNEMQLRLGEIKRDLAIRVKLWYLGETREPVLPRHCTTA